MTALRAVLVIAGGLILARALGLLRSGGWPEGARQSCAVGRVVLTAAAVRLRFAPARVDMERRQRLVWIGMAPESWPARLVARALRYSAERGGRTSTSPRSSGLPGGLSPAVDAAMVVGGRRAAAGPPDLSHLLAGVQLLAGGMAATIVMPGVVVGGGTVALGVVAAVMCAVASARIPPLVLRRRATAARRQAERATPGGVEMLASAVGAGVPLDRALTSAAAHVPHGLAAAFRGCALRAAAGEEVRRAFEVEAERWGVPALVDVGVAVERQRRLGTPLAAELWTLAGRLRVEARALALERAARRGPLATLVVAAVIAPLCVAALVACVVGGLVLSHGATAV